MLASASGPLIASLVRDRFGTYDGIKFAGTAVAAIGIIILNSLEPDKVPNSA
jgi:hypothetical protein